MQNNVQLLNQLLNNNFKKNSHHYLEAEMNASADQLLIEDTNKTVTRTCGKK